MHLVLNAQAFFVNEMFCAQRKNVYFVWFDGSIANE